MINLALKDVNHHFGRFILTTIGVGLLLGLVLSMMGIFRGLSWDALVLLEEARADIWVVEDGTKGPFAEASRVYEDIKYKVLATPGVLKASAITYQNMQIRYKGNFKRTMAVGYEMGGLGEPSKIVEGRKIRNRFEIIVDKKLGIDIKEEIKIGRDFFRVVGLTKGAVSSGGDPVVYMLLEDAQKIQFLGSNEKIRNDRDRGIKTENHQNLANAIVVQVKPGTDIEALASYIRNWKGLEAISQSGQEELLLKNVIEKAKKQIGLFTAILVIVAAVIIGMIIYTMTMEKIKEIAILKLIGASNFIIVKMIVQQSILLGAGGFLIGYVLINLSYDKFPRNVILLPGDTMALLAITIAITLLASLFGVRSALRVDPATAIGG